MQNYIMSKTNARSNQMAHNPILGSKNRGNDVSRLFSSLCNTKAEISNLLTQIKIIIVRKSRFKKLACTANGRVRIYNSISSLIGV